ncbi:hypothetical protein [Exiguobacterium aurantiacum]|uniref:hypothetical protein n=1 Tax=Exiguobacterium aurantiacum TaxID=33987 RepID=UPI001E57B696|nr:hypothetical protein [Exiguobacterium aurantiacum]
MQEQTNELIGFDGIEVSYTLLTQERPSHQLAVLLPGFRYSTSAPMFHFTTSLLLERSIDVLEINYEYFRDDYAHIKDISYVVRHDVRTVIDHVLSTHEYEAFIFVGKSLGTVALAHELTRPIFQDAHVIWLTPLLQREDVTHTIATSQVSQLVVIGDEDHCYTTNRFDALTAVPSVKTHLLSGVHHGLEREADTLGSIKVLQDVMEAIDAFLPRMKSIATAQPSKKE